MLHSRCRWLDRRDTCLGDWVRWVVLFLFGGDGVVQTYVSAEALLAVQRDGHVGRFSLVEINKSAAFKLAGFEIRQPPYLLYLTAAFEEGLCSIVIHTVPDDVITTSHQNVRMSAYIGRGSLLC